MEAMGAVRARSMTPPWSITKCYDHCLFFQNLWSKINRNQFSSWKWFTTLSLVHILLLAPPPPKKESKQNEGKKNQKNLHSALPRNQSLVSDVNQILLLQEMWTWTKGGKAWWSCAVLYWRWLAKDFLNNSWCYCKVNVRLDKYRHNWGLHWNRHDTLKWQYRSLPKGSTWKSHNANFL